MTQISEGEAMKCYVLKDKAAHKDYEIVGAFLTKKKAIKYLNDLVAFSYGEMLEGEFTISKIKLNPKFKVKLYV